MISPILPAGCVERCRGCKHRLLTRADSLAQKQTFLATQLSDWCNVLEPVRSVADDARWHYRTRTTMSAALGPSGWQLGMWSRDELIPIPQCPVHTHRVNAALEAVAAHTPANSATALAYVVVSGNQVVLVLKTKQKPQNWNITPLTSVLQQHGFEGLWLHLNPSAGKRLFEKCGWQLLWGQPRSADFNGLLYGPAAFQQLLAMLYNQSLHEAERFLSPDEHTAVADLYCGNGNSMRRWAQCGARVLGVEVGGDAVECARLNVPQAEVLRGACRLRLPQIAAWCQVQAEQEFTLAMYVNPPRTGIEVEVLEWLCKHRLPKRIGYLSCSPGTLAKNLMALTANGYAVHRLVPFDFFPQTHHVECLALLERE